MTMLFTAYCALPDTPRGRYDEEVDVEARNTAQARRKAERIIADEYDDRLRVRRVMRRTPVVTFLR